MVNKEPTPGQKAKGERDMGQNNDQVVNYLFNKRKKKNGKWYDLKEKMV